MDFLAEAAAAVSSNKRPHQPPDVHDVGDCAAALEAERRKIQRERDTLLSTIEEERRTVAAALEKERLALVAERQTVESESKRVRGAEMQLEAKRLKSKAALEAAWGKLTAIRAQDRHAVVAERSQLAAALKAERLAAQMALEAERSRFLAGAEAERRTIVEALEAERCQLAQEREQLAEQRRMLSSKATPFQRAAAAAAAMTCRPPLTAAPAWKSNI